MHANIFLVLSFLLFGSVCGIFVILSNRATAGSIAQMFQRGQVGMSKLFLSRLKELQGSNSVSAFARYLEMPQKTVDTYIKEQRKPSVEFVTRVCSKCHVSADWLLGLTDQRSPFIEVPRENKVSKTVGNEEKFPSFIRPICRSVRQSERVLNPKEISDILCNLSNEITQLKTQISALQSTSIATCG